MDRASKAVDEYIENPQYHQYDEDFTCLRCGFRWTAHMYSEYGGGFFNNEDDAYCPRCGLAYDDEIFQLYRCYA